MIGIYGIRNIRNGKIYIGQTADIKNRWMSHKSELRAGRHHNKHLQSAWDKYGEDAFLFFKIEECPVEYLDSYETFWIMYYNSMENGYNLDLGGKGIRGYKHTAEEIDKMIQIQKPKRVVQLDLDMNYIQTWVSASTAAKSLGYGSYSGIKRCCEKDGYKKSYGYRWVFEEDWLSGNIDYDYYFGEAPNSTKRISQYDASMNLICIYSSPKDAAMAVGGKASSICAALNPLDHDKYLGFIWRRTDYYTDEEYVSDVEWDYTKYHTTKIYPIEQYDMNWNYIATYPSVREALIANNIKSRNIAVCFKNPKRTCGGFHWKKVIA